MPVFLFTDIEGSTQKWERYREVMGGIIARHNAILEEEVTRVGGKIIKFTGDGIFAVFEDVPNDASLECGIRIQERFEREAWPGIGELRVRMAFHVGEAERVGDDYFGPVANRTARLMALGWGGQILVSEDLKKLTQLPSGAAFVDHGSHQVKDIPDPQRVFGVVHEGLKLREFPPLKSLSAHPHNLPTEISPFVGRRAELLELTDLLVRSRERLVTLVGPGGMGKTRVAIRAGLENLAEFRDGVFFVDLAPLSDPHQIPNKIAEAIGLRFYEQDPPDAQLKSYLRSKELLLILDNFEHVSAGASIAAELLIAAPKLQILVTSRERLNLGSERILEILGLGYSGTEHEDEEEGPPSAVQLFLNHAERVKRHFSMPPAESPWLVKICELVDGMPLGLELAATWLRVLSLKEVAERIEKDVASLSSNQRDLPERHRSIRAVFMYSWNTLSEDERRVLERISVFKNGCDYHAAEFVTEGSLEALGGLVDKSLLRVGHNGRYTLHEAVRQFAAQKLGERAEELRATLDRHGRYFAGFLEEREASVYGYEQLKGFGEIRAEFENLLLAWEHAVKTRNVPVIARSAPTFTLYLVLQGLGTTYERVITSALDLWESGVDLGDVDPDTSTKAHAVLLLRRGFSFHQSQEYERAQPYVLRSLELFRKCSYKVGLADCLVSVTVVCYGGDMQRRSQYLLEARDVYEELGDENGLAWANANYSVVLRGEGHPEEADRLLEESLKVFRAVGNRKEEGWALVMLSPATEGPAREESAARLNLALEIFKELHELNAAAIVFSIIAERALERSEEDAALSATEEGLTLFQRLGYQRGITRLTGTRQRILERRSIRPSA